jgi:hypothetical protein
MQRIIFEPAECDCRHGTCHYLHSPGWWAGGVSFETEKEAEAYAVALLVQDLATEIRRQRH